MDLSKYPSLGRYIEYLKAELNAGVLLFPKDKELVELWDALVQIEADREKLKNAQKLVTPEDTPLCLRPASLLIHDPDLSNREDQERVIKALSHGFGGQDLGRKFGHILNKIDDDLLDALIIAFPQAKVKELRKGVERNERDIPRLKAALARTDKAAK